MSGVSVPRPSLEPTSIEARYSIERELGRGGNGAVFLVRDRETGEALALKKLLRVDAEGVLGLKREFRSLADLHHRNLVKMYDMGRASDAWFITMEYLDGLDLLSYLRQPTAADGTTGSASIERVVGAFQQLAAG